MAGKLKRKLLRLFESPVRKAGRKAGGLRKRKGSAAKVAAKFVRAARKK